jgi:hypothetical protein
MYQTIYAQDFRDAFRAIGHTGWSEISIAELYQLQITPSAYYLFSYDGLGLIFNHLEEVTPDAELNIDAICRAYTEDMPASIAEDCSIDTEDMGEGETLDAVLKHLNEKTHVVGVTDAGAIVYCSEF